MDAQTWNQLVQFLVCLLNWLGIPSLHCTILSLCKFQVGMEHIYTGNSEYTRLLWGLLKLVPCNYDHVSCGHANTSNDTLKFELPSVSLLVYHYTSNDTLKFIQLLSTKNFNLYYSCIQCVYYHVTDQPCGIPLW